MAWTVERSPRLAFHRCAAANAANRAQVTGYVSIQSATTRSLSDEDPSRSGGVHLHTVSDKLHASNILYSLSRLRRSMHRRRRWSAWCVPTRVVDPSLVQVLAAQEQPAVDRHHLDGPGGKVARQ